jgi:hypothetical protein
LEGAGVGDPPSVLDVGVQLYGDGPVGADGETAVHPGRLHDREGGPERSAGRDHDVLGIGRGLQGLVHGRGHVPVVVDQGAVDVEPEQHVVLALIA